MVIKLKRVTLVFFFYLTRRLEFLFKNYKDINIKTLEKHPNLHKRPVSTGVCDELKNKHKLKKKISTCEVKHKSGI